MTLALRFLPFFPCTLLTAQKGLRFPIQKPFAVGEHPISKTNNPAVSQVATPSLFLYLQSLPLTQWNPDFSASGGNGHKHGLHGGWMVEEE